MAARFDGRIDPSIEPRERANLGSVDHHAQRLIASGPPLDEARVVKTDIAASNGVIHVIDSVILPDAAKN